MDWTTQPKAASSTESAATVSIAFCFIVADASGKGTAAALMISSVQTALRLALSFWGQSPAAAVATVNSYFHKASLPDCYVTVFCGIYDHSQRTLRYVNAGHPPPMLFRQDHSFEWLEKGGAPVGMFDSGPYVEGTATLNAGDVFVAYTDGITEASNGAGEEWGSQGLESIVRRNGSRSAAAIISSIFDGMSEFADGTQADDATALVFRADDLGWIRNDSQSTCRVN
ncbi:MAG: serine/threonine-protein phosphatase [Acidobacteria bacterium]|nr:serine/threonine-protein phosphatase [Acidobacteriota bacterium]